MIFGPASSSPWENPAMVVATRSKAMVIDVFLTNKMYLYPVFLVLQVSVFV